MVKPKAGWDTRVALAAGMQYPLPSGRVTTVAPFGKGQVIKIDGYPFMLAGCFELDEVAA